MTRKPALPPLSRRLLSACMMLVLFACHAPALLSIGPDGTAQAFGGVQLFNTKIQKAYGAYLKEMAANLRKQGLYDIVAAIHLETGDAAGLPEEVDYSPFTRERWQKFMKERYGKIDALNKAAGTEYKSFDALEVPAKGIEPAAAADWEEFSTKGNTRDANAWGRHLTEKYKSDTEIVKAIGRSYRDAYGWRLPYDYPPVIKIDYLHFRRAWMKEYLSIKRDLAAAAFPEKLIIAEMYQMGDHDGIAGASEQKWGGLLADDFGQCTGVGPIDETKITVTIPRGIFSGGRAEKTDRKPPFEALKPATATVLAAYEGGKPAITVNTHGKGRAVTMGYPFGREATEADRTSIGFQRTYTWFVREPQVVDRTAWLRKFIVEDLGYRPDYGVDYAEVARFDGKEARALGVCLPKGFSEDPANYLFIRSVGDPRPGHELEVQHETPDIAIRFFPRHSAGVNSTFLGISTRDVHYISPRGTVNMHLSQHTYRCRINNPRVQAIWDVARDVPVGFDRDDTGVAFSISLPSGHIMMLAYSENPKVQLLGRGAFPGRGKDEVLARCTALAGGTTPPPVVILAKDDLRPWLQGLAESEKGKKVFISYGEAANKPAADKLAAVLRGNFAIDAETVEQTSAIEDPNNPDVRLKNHYAPLIYIGNDWNNNDMAAQAAFWNWNAKYDPHVPFTSTYAWPGAGRAVVSLSRRYALITQGGDVMNWIFRHDWRVRKVEDRFWQVRRRLHIGADGEAVVRAVDAIIAVITQ